MSVTSNGASSRAAPSDDPLLGDITLRIQTELDQLDANYTQLETEYQQTKQEFANKLQAISKQRTRYRRVLKATKDLANAAPAPKKSYPGKVTPYKARKIKELVEKIDKEKFSVLDLFWADRPDAEDTAGAAGYYDAVNKLNRMEYLGKAGWDPKTRRRLYRVLDPSVIERLINA